MKASPEQLDALFDNILHNDVIDDGATLPTLVEATHTQSDLIACHAISEQLLRERVDIPSFRALVQRIGVRRVVSPTDRVAFKHARAKYKHFRFACANLDADHAYPWSVNFATTLMGHLQDAFKNARRDRTVIWAILLRLMLTRLPCRMMRSQIDAYTPTTPALFRAYLLSENARLARILADTHVTGRIFHDTRKIISRRVAFYVTLRVVAPSVDHDRTSRFLATINGMMGSMHDDLIEQKLAGTLDYERERFLLPDAIRQRLTAFLSAHA